MLDIERIKQLVDMMVANDLVEISLRDGDVEVSLRRPTGAANDPASVAIHPAASNPMPNPVAAAVGAADEKAPPGRAGDDELLSIKSPMVGTFYTAPDPDSPPYVQAGGQVNPNSVVCIIEAMKVFNEIKAEVTGTIERILVKNEESVEFGQPMFLIRP